MQWFKRISHLNGLNAWAEVSCGQKDGQRMDRNWMPILHLAKASATKSLYLSISCRKMYEFNYGF